MSQSQRELDASFSQLLASGLHGLAFDNHLALCLALGRPIEAYKTLRLRCDAAGLMGDDWYDWFNATTAAFNANLIEETLICATKTISILDTPADIRIRAVGMLVWAQHFSCTVDRLAITETQSAYLTLLRSHPVMQSIPPFDRKGDASSGSKKRIGYLWEFFGASVNFCMPKHHDRHKYYVVGVGKRMAGQSAHELGFDQFIDHHPAGPARTIELVREANLDLLIDLNGRGGSWTSDLMMEARLAPLQAAYGNFFGTIASPSIDLLIGDQKILDAIALGDYTERLVPIKGTIMAVQNPAWDPHLGCRGAPPRPYRHRIGTTGNLLKISDDLIQLIIRVLNRIQCCSFFYSSIPSVDHKDFLLNKFIKFGANPSQIELFTKGKVDYVSSINAIDAAIDSIPYNGHLSTTEFLSLGCPVWSLAGKKPSQQFGRMILASLGEQEYVFEEEEALISTLAGRIVIRNGGDPNGLKRKIVDSRLVDPIRATRLFEEALDDCLIGGVPN